MRTIFIVFWNNFKREFNNKGKFFISLLLPVLAIILAIFVNSISTASINIGVAQNADFNESKRIISLLKETKGINIKIIDENYLKTDAILGKYAGAITFKKDFNKGQVKDIDKYFDFYTVSDSKLKDQMKDIVKYYLDNNHPLSLNSFTDGLQKNSLSKAARIISFLATVLIITCVINATLIIKDKAENTFARFMYSPNNRFQYVIGNVMYNYIFSYIQLSLALVIVNICGIDIGISLSNLLIYGLLLILLTTTFGTLIACIFNKELYANLFSAAISMIFSLIGGSFITYEQMPKGLQLISKMTPNRWIIKSVDLMQNNTLSGINPNIVLFAFCIIFSGAAVLLIKMVKVQQ